MTVTWRRVLEQAGIRHPGEAARCEWCGQHVGPARMVRVGSDVYCSQAHADEGWAAGQI